MSKKIVVVGSCNVDLQCFTQRLPKPGETLHGKQFMKGCGGKGANQCVAAAKLGASTAMIARVGDDSFGQDFIKAFKSYNVNTDLVKISKNVSTGMAQITVSDNGENTIVVVAGANNELSVQDMQDSAKVIEEASVIVFQFEIPIPTTIEALKLKKLGKGISIVNAAPAIGNPDPQIFKLSDIFCVNESEAEIITNLPVTCIDEGKVALNKLLEKGCNQVIITLGPLGALYGSKTDEVIIHVTTRKVNAVDTTGAGDMFIGALAFYLAYYPNLQMREVLRRSCELATLSVLRPGTQLSFPSRNELPLELFSSDFI
ncbi:hypothetical protein L9F63_011548, partial [Diploptera punctata]